MQPARVALRRPGPFAKFFPETGASRLEQPFASSPALRG